MSLAYPIWTGIGAIGIVVVGIVFLKDQLSPLAYFFDFGCHWNYRFKNDQRTLSLLEKISNFTSFFTAFWVE